jgi:hypothetical protein
MTPNLRSLQTLLYKAITAEPRAAVGLDDGILLDVIRSDERLSARERIGIYAKAYFYRLLDCLREDFPATAAVASASAFEDLIRAYLTRHPPTKPSIFYAGRYLSDFLAAHPLRERWPFLPELARLERMLIEVFHGPDAPPLSAHEIQIFRPDQWPALRLHVHPALRMLDSRWRVNDVLQAVESGRQWQEPELGPVLLLVWRQGSRVYYRELEAPEGAALEAASEGVSFDKVCAAFASWFDDGNPAAAISQMLARWLADGILARAQSPL